MKKLLVFLLFSVLIACVNDQVRIEFNNNKKTIYVLSNDFKISTILINEMKGDKQLDSVYASIDFEKPIQKADLKHIKNGKFYGQPLDEMITKKNLIYKITLKKMDTDSIQTIQLIFFKSADLKRNRQIFKSWQ